MQTTTIITACSTLAQALGEFPPIHGAMESAYDRSLAAAISLDDASTEEKGLVEAEHNFQRAAECEATKFLDFKHHARKIRAAMRQVGELLDRVEAVYEPGDGTVRGEISVGSAAPSPLGHPRKQCPSPADESPPAA